jgi:hypothetical protein
VHIPSIPRAGGFTITSPPWTAVAPSSSSSNNPPSPPSDPDPNPDPTPSIELALLASASPPTAFFFRAAPAILGTALTIRAGGAFVYPPPALSHDECERVDNAVFVAGGVGVNPVVSMVCAMAGVGGGGGPGRRRRAGGVPARVRLLYATKRYRGEGRARVAFYARIRGVVERWSRDGAVDARLAVFETGQVGGVEGDDEEEEEGEGGCVRHVKGRIRHEDLMEALGSEGKRADTVVYVCGPPAMTDEFVEVFKRAPGMEERRVLCEKWW